MPLPHLFCYTGSDFSKNGIVNKLIYSLQHCCQADEILRTSNKLVRLDHGELRGTIYPSTQRN